MAQVLDIPSTNGHMEEPTAITVGRLTRAEVKVTVEGITPLIVHRFDEKARAMMLADQQGKKKAGKEKRDPEGDYNRSRYILDGDRDGFPAVGLKAAVVNAATHFDKLTKVLLKQAVWVGGEGAQQLIAINGTPEMREDVVRVGMGTADLRFRAMYWPWSMDLTVGFIASSVSAETVVNLIDAAGMGGIGEWRPSAPKSATGSYGQFQVKEG